MSSADGAGSTEFAPSASSSSSSMAHQRLRFEVFGKVQRVFFRQFTVEDATALRSG
jgi:hypothetical protein